MQLVSADTGPINLPARFDTVILPSVVRDELVRPKAPPQVRDWMEDPPEWVEVRQTNSVHDLFMANLDAGEEAAITLAVELHADMLLMDDREDVLVARSQGFRVSGTLGILAMAAQRDLLQLAEAFGRIKQTSFHYRQELMDQFLAEQADKT